MQNIASDTDYEAKNNNIRITVLVTERDPIYHVRIAKQITCVRVAPPN